MASVDDLADERAHAGKPFVGGFSHERLVQEIRDVQSVTVRSSKL